MTTPPPVAAGAILGWSLVPPVQEANASRQQRAMMAAFHAARGTEGQPLPDMFALLLHSPEGARRLAALTAYCRFHSGLSPLQREVALLSSCYATGFDYEIRHHEPLALEAGLEPGQLQSLSAGDWIQLPADVAVVAQLSRAVALGTSLRRTDLEAQVRQALSPRQIVDVTMTASAYRALHCIGAVLSSMEDLPCPS